MVTLMNCDELLSFMYSNYETPYQGYLEFQGDILPMNGMSPSVDMIIVSPKFKRTAFIVGPTVDDEFKLSIVKDWAFMDELPSVVLPEYVKIELIETIKGNW
jgi:hypothetical protein